MSAFVLKASSLARFLSSCSVAVRSGLGGLVAAAAAAEQEEGELGESGEASEALVVGTTGDAWVMSSPAPGPLRGRGSIDGPVPVLPLLQVTVARVTLGVTLIACLRRHSKPPRRSRSTALAARPNERTLESSSSWDDGLSNAEGGGGARRGSDASALRGTQLVIMSAVSSSATGPAAACCGSASNIARTRGERTPPASDAEDGGVAGSGGAGR